MIDYAFPDLDSLPEYDPFEDRDWSAVYGLSSLNPTLARIGPAIFMPLSRQIEEYKASAPKPYPPLYEFFEFVSSRITDEAYAKIQRRHLNKAAIRYLLLVARDKTAWQFSPWEKYLAFPFWASGKFKYAVRLGLNKRSPMDILDLGVGPAHFPLVCKYFGHNCLGLDMYLEPSVPGLDTHIYDDLCQLFEVQRVTRNIERSSALGIEGRFDMATCWMTTFHCPFELLPDGSSVCHHWSPDDWMFFLRHLKQDLMQPEFEIHFQLSGSTSAAEVDLLTRLSAKATPERFLFMVNQQATL